MTRGEIYRSGFPRAVVASTPGLATPVIVHADELLGLSTAVVAPTSRSAAPATFRPEIKVGTETTRVLVEQMRAVDIERLDSPEGRLSVQEQRAVDEALALVLDLS